MEKQFIKIEQGGFKSDKITNYYFKDLMAKVKTYYNNWTIEEALNYKPLIEFYSGKSDKNKKVFPDSMSLAKKVETCFRLCGFKTASKPSNFPLKTVDDILQQYNVNGKYYDYACGWGARLLSSLRNNVEYYGNDPNVELITRLNAMCDAYKTATGNTTYVEIHDTGSEIFIPEWENKFGLAFSSPPYFNLEDYVIGNQSYKQGMTYDVWLQDYFKQTVKNIHRYLISDGFFLININNFKGCPTLVHDARIIIEQVVFVLVDTHQLKNITRVSGHRHMYGDNTIKFHDNDERILVFEKDTK